jgi:excisionase family DNA binding protein
MHESLIDKLSPMEELESVLRVRDVAAVLRCSQSQVYATIARGEIPSVRIGERAVRVTRRDLEAFLASRRSAGSLRGAA